MKKITLLLLLLVSTTLIFAQENHKKCITTKLVEEELKNNTDYVDARQNAGKINYNSKEKKRTLFLSLFISFTEHLMQILALELTFQTFKLKTP